MSRALLAGLILLWPAAASAQQAIIIVRHAERQTGEGDDGLSDTGRLRADRLASMLRDAGVTHIFVSDRRRTLETAEPFAKAHNLSPTRMAIPAQGRGTIEPSGLQVRATLLAISRLPRTAVVLVVGHSNTVPMFLTRLGYGPNLTIPDAEFDNLFVVTPRATRSPSVVRLRF
ncbi:MAG: phosphoglycerate mutase family protein [Vicinamibacterales bacterium]